jgi:hypothetical protein
MTIAELLEKLTALHKEADEITDALVLVLESEQEGKGGEGSGGARQGAGRPKKVEADSDKVEAKLEEAGVDWDRSRGDMSDDGIVSYLDEDGIEVARFVGTGGGKGKLTINKKPTSEDGDRADSGDMYTSDTNPLNSFMMRR